MNGSDTLGAALIRAGQKDQAEALPKEVQDLTKEEIINFLNGEHQNAITLGQVKGFRKYAKFRIKKGQSVLPWSEEDLDTLVVNRADDTMGGGFW